MVNCKTENTNLNEMWIIPSCCFSGKMMATIIHTLYRNRGNVVYPKVLLNVVQMTAYCFSLQFGTLSQS